MSRIFGAVAITGLTLLTSITLTHTSAASEVIIDLPQFKVSHTNKLPRGPNPQRWDDNCANRYATPSTPAGREVQQNGWAVTSERRLGHYWLVSFAGRLEPSTSAMCVIEQGNIGVYESGKLLAIIYTARSDDTLIGSLSPLDTGSLRVWDGDHLSQPIADIVLDSQNVRLTHIVDVDHFCDGKITVPTVFGADITDARREIIAAGWTPTPMPSEGLGMQPKLHEIGIYEAETCSGTGNGFCKYRYENGRAKMSVVTAGELFENYEPAVAWYTVSCF